MLNFIKIRAHTVVQKIPLNINRQQVAKYDSFKNFQGIWSRLKDRSHPKKGNIPNPSCALALSTSLRKPSLGCFFLTNLSIIYDNYSMVTDPHNSQTTYLLYPSSYYQNSDKWIFFLFIRDHRVRLRKKTHTLFHLLCPVESESYI